MRARILGYDLLKALAILMVVQLHYAFYALFMPQGFLARAITAACVVCVPLFFTINGALTFARAPQSRSLSAHYRSCLGTLISVLLWKLIHVVFYMITLPVSHDPLALRDIVIFLMGGPLGDFVVGHFWFMHALLASSLILPAITYLFASRDLHYTPLLALAAVLTIATIGRDTLLALIEIFDAASQHHYASLLGGTTEFYIFSHYGYTLLYGIAGGIITKLVQATPEEHVLWPQWLTRFFTAVRTKSLLAWGIVAVCFVLTLILQQIQRHFFQVVFTVNYGYTLLPTFIATIVLVIIATTINKKNVPSPAKAFLVLGSATYGVYMLHVIALMFFRELQQLPWISEVFAHPIGGNIGATFLHVICSVALTFVCLGVTLVARKIPYVKKLFL